MDDFTIINLQDLTTATNLTVDDLLAVGQGNNALAKAKISQVGALLGVSASVVVGDKDIEPTVPSFAFAEAGTYTEWGNVEITGNLGILIFDGTSFSKTEINFVANGLVEQGNTQSVSGGEVYSNILKNNFLNQKKDYSQYNQIRNLNNNIISIKSLPYDGFLVLNTLSLSTTSIGISVALLSAKDETQSNLANFTVASVSATFADVTTVGIVTLRLNSFNNNGFWMEITINISELWKDYIVFNSRPDTSWLNAGFLQEKINFVQKSNLINTDSTTIASEKNKAAIIDRVVRSIRAFDSTLLSDYLIVSAFVFSSNTYSIFISKKNAPTEQATAVSPSLIARANINVLKGKHTVNIVDNSTQSIILGEVDVDLDLLPNNFPYISTADNPTYLTRGIKQNKIVDVFSKRAISSGGITVVEYPSVYDAFQANSSTRIIIGNKELVSDNFPLSSKFDYKSKGDIEIPGLTIMDTKSWKYSTRTIKLRDYHNGYYYFQGDYHILRTNDLNTDTSTWEIMASTSSLGINVYPFNNIRIVNNELVISAKQGANFVYFWQNLDDKIPREITVDGVTNNYYIAPENGSMILPFSISVYGNIYLMSLYDIGASGVSRGSSQKAFLSTDRGVTFTKIFDFDYPGIDSSWNTANKQKSSFHIHGITYDPYWRRIWITTGDGATYLDNTSLFWSDDLGVSWKWKKMTEKENPTGSRQIMNLIPFEDHLIGLSDSGYVGVSRVNRNLKSNFTIENAIRYGVNELYAWGRNYVWHKDVLYMTFGYQAGATSAGGFLLSTIDGYDYKKVWEDSGAGVQSDWSMWVVSDGRYLYLNLDNANGNTLVFEV